jgi:hypothetical protein
MTQMIYYLVKNAMIFSILISNLIGVAIAQYFTQRYAFLSLPDIVRIDAQIGMYFLPASLLMSVALILIYERPIRSYLKAHFKRKALPADLVLIARQRLLNEPFFLIGLSFCMWLAAAVVYSGVFGFMPGVVIRITFCVAETGLITVTVAFMLESVLQGSRFRFFPGRRLFDTRDNAHTHPHQVTAFRLQYRSLFHSAAYPWKTACR